MYGNCPVRNCRLMTADQIDEALKKLLSGKNYSRVTVQGYVDGVRCFFRFAEVRGWWRSQDKTKWYGEQLAARGMKVLPPSVALKAGLHQVGERLTGEWLTRAGGDGQAVIDAYRKLGT